LKNIREMEGTLMPQRGRTNSSRRRDNSNESTGFSDFDDVYDDDERKGRNSRESAGFAGLDNEGFARLFIARGEKDGLNEKALVAYLYDNAGTRKEEIRDIEVHDNFSFISTSYPVAEHLINVFESHANGGRPIIQKANASPNSHSRSRKPRDYQKRSGNRSSNNRRDEDDFIAYSENSRYPKNVKRNHKRR
ncbi:MAG: DbpA RNA binding domain-containing protein, partial [Sphaerochaetaceae bacterium]